MTTPIRYSSISFSVDNVNTDDNISNTHIIDNILLMILIY